jgi:phage baseplate assembly protein W
VTNVDVPFHFDDRGRTATTGESDHVRDLIEAVLLTAPGDRVMRPDFGSGLLTMTFEPGSPELASALELTLQASLQRWLGDLIDVRRVEVTSVESTVGIVIEYALRRTGELGSATIRVPS